MLAPASRAGTSPPDANDTTPSGGTLPGMATSSARRADATWPADSALVALAAQHGSMSAVARACGRSRESLRDFLAIRPALDCTVRAHLRPRLTPEQAKSNDRRAKREYQARQRCEDPDEVRRQRRESWHRTTTPERRRAGNLRTRTARAHLVPAEADWLRVLALDPCAYCGASCAEVDHIIPVVSGGDSSPENLTASCLPCNRGKNARPLLVFLADEGRPQ